MKLTSTEKTIPSPHKPQATNGFAKVVAGGRIVRIDLDKPYLQRMVTGGTVKTKPTEVSREKAVLDSVTANLEAGIKITDAQELSLAKIGGKLSLAALNLNKGRNPSSTHEQKLHAQEDFVNAITAIKEETISTFDNTALFSNGKSKPITIAVPTGNEWEGLSVDRSDVGQPGLIAVMKGKVYGDGPGYFLEHDSIKKAFAEWRSLCTQNRMNWAMLVERLHGIESLGDRISKGFQWNLPDFPTDPNLGPLRRPHRNN